MVWCILALLNKGEEYIPDWETLKNMSEYNKILDSWWIMLAQLTGDAPNIFLEVGWNPILSSSLK